MTAILEAMGRMTAILEAMGRMTAILAGYGSHDGHIGRLWVT